MGGTTTSMDTKTPISIWFFVGLTLLFNGALILGTGLYEIEYPPQTEFRVVLYGLHAGVWWGALLLACGAAYCYHFRPWRKR
jgi:hypothetical protein